MTSQAQLQQALQAHQQGDLERARSGYLALLKQSPQHSEALHLLGVCEFQSGHAEAAIQHINSAIAHAPSIAAYHNNLGEVLRHCDRIGEAEQAYQRALELNPRYADAHNNLALVLQFRGQLDAAAVHLRTALELQPQAPQTLANLGNVLRLKGDQHSACTSYRQALDLAPNFSEARLALCQLLIDLDKNTQAESTAEVGVQLDSKDPASLCARACVAIAMQQYSQARQWLQTCVQMNPHGASVQMTLGRCLLHLGESPAALPWLEQAALQIPTQAQIHSLLSQAYVDLNRLDDAYESILKALQLAPDKRNYQIQLARVCRFQDRIAEAIQSLLSVLDDDPANLPATLELVEVYMLTGEDEQAQKLLQQALVRDPDNHTVRERLASLQLSTGEIKSSLEHLSQIIAQDPERISTYQLLSQAKRFSAEDEAILTALNELLETPELPPQQVAIGHYSLGKMLADCGRHGQAFEHFKQANQLRRKQVDYDKNHHAAFVQERIAVFEPQRLERLSTFGHPSRLPIIIAGMPRSGTTLAERILASHPQVAAGGEIDALTRIVPLPMGSAPKQNYLGLALDSLDKATASRLGQDYLARLGRAHPEAVRITDKTPQNFLHLGMATFLLPQAPIIHCFRHPMATCMSLYSRDMNLGNEFSYRMDELAHYYGQYQKMMRHWHKVMPGRIYDLSYERLITDFEGVCRELLAFCGLNWNPQCLEFHTTAGTVLTASDWQVRQPLYARAVNAWQHYEVQLEPLRKALLDNGVTLD